MIVVLAHREAFRTLPPGRAQRSDQPAIVVRMSGPADGRAQFLEAIPPSGFDVPNPSDELAPDEDPYDPNEPEMATGSPNLDEA